MKGGRWRGWWRLRLPVLANIGSDACVDACGNLYLNQYFHSRQIKLYSLNSTGYEPGKLLVKTTVAPSIVSLVNSLPHPTSLLLNHQYHRCHSFTNRCIHIPRRFTSVVAVSIPHSSSSWIRIGVMGKRSLLDRREGRMWHCWGAFIAARLDTSKPCVLYGSIVWKGWKKEGLEAKAMGTRKQGQQVSLLDLGWKGQRSVVTPL